MPCLKDEPHKCRGKQIAGRAEARPFKTEGPFTPYPLKGHRLRGRLPWKGQDSAGPQVRKQPKGGRSKSLGALSAPCGRERAHGVFSEKLRGGFTLVEVLVAVVVAVLVFVAFFSLQIHGVRTRTHARLASTALNVASDFLEQLLSFGEAPLSLDGQPIDDAGFAARAVATGSGVVFARRWEVSRGVPAPNLITVRVMVCWKEPRRPLLSEATCRFDHPSAPHVALEQIYYRP
ncbi:MAG: prepilin-type N-terminal cleavage/methylation domain-containing protein [Desulfosoma sp.]|uniref:prepilin-type N-terminal cleavage/methylation domain-containing protein n=1 Tax=Desulfosoma sp. TaxID=2603217 RepID=UPI00404AB1FF